MNVIFATNFSNEQGAIVSERLLVTPDTAIRTSDVMTVGYYLSLSAGANLQLPNVSPIDVNNSVVYGCSVTVDAGEENLNIFGHTNVTAGTSELVSVIHNGNTYLYKNGRYVGKQSGEFKTFTTTGDTTFTLHNIYVVNNVQGIQALAFDFIATNFTEVSNAGWVYNGNTLIESITKDSALQADPSISTDTVGEKVVINAGSADDLLLVELAGYAEDNVHLDYAIYAEEAQGSIKALQGYTDEAHALKSIVVQGGNLSFYRDLPPLLAIIKSTGTDEVVIQIQGAGLTIDWGDGTPEVNATNNAIIRHTYPAGDYQLEVKGQGAQSIRISGTAFKGLTQWGNLGANHYAFYIPSVTPSSEDLSLPNYLPKHITSLKEMFRGRDYAVDNGWDTSHVIDFSGMLQDTKASGTFSNLSFASAKHADDFMNNSLANPEIGHLKPENLVTANRMFKNAVNFTTSIQRWYTLGNLEQAEEFLYGAVSYNTDLNTWCVSKLTSMPTNFADAGVTWDLPNWGTCEVPTFCNNDDVCYIDWDMTGNPLNAETFISYAEFSELVGMQSTGTLNTQAGADEWLNMTIDGQEVVFSKVPVRFGVSYQQLYEKGLVFGMPGDGPYTIGTATDQDTKVMIDGTEYLVRLFSGIDDMRGTWSGAASGTNLAGTQRSEWSRLLLPLVKEPSAYVDTKLADFSQVDLGIGTGIDGRSNWVMERSGTSTTRLFRGDTSTPYLGSVAGTTTTSAYGWRVMLVKLRSVFPPEDLFYTTDYVQAPIITDYYYKD